MEARKFEAASTLPIPGAITLNDLLAGDILIYRASKTMDPAQILITFLQSLISYKHGHCDTTHAAICVGHTAKGPQIAHIGPNGYICHPLAEYGEDALDRAFFVFVP